jgi:RNA polymerase sigma-70 factor (ECF subfamily)
MNLNPKMKDDILRCIPALRGYAISLSRSRDRADDLVQETLTRAIAHIDMFEPGTNLAAWLFTILRNSFRNEYRKSKRIELHPDERYAESVPVLAEQVGWCVAVDLRAGLETLSSAHRQALFLVGASGLSYDAAAVIAGCRVGTMKSRVNRARRLLAAHMSGETEETGAVGRARPQMVDHQPAA